MTERQHYELIVAIIFAGTLSKSSFSWEEVEPLEYAQQMADKIVQLKEANG